MSFVLRATIQLTSQERLALERTLGVGLLHREDATRWGEYVLRAALVKLVKEQAGQGCAKKKGD